VTDILQGPITAFDVIIIAVLVVSAVMSLGRGLIREASSVISFILGGLAAYYTLVLFRQPMEAIVPDSWPAISASAILVVVGFLVAYTLAAFLGGQLSRLIKASPEIGMVDRIAGAAFGVARGALAVILFVLLMQQVLPEEATPRFVADSRFFPFAEAAAEWIRNNVPGFVDRARDTLPPLNPQSPGRI
jgi:membrane protein required for colicin V production